MKKVGLITYYGNNYGGCLQAYAIQHIIMSLGYTANILQVNIPLKGGRNNTIKAIIRVLKNPIAFIKRRKYIKEYSKNEVIRNEAFNKFRREFLIFDKSFVLRENSLEVASDYSAYVCGSDQIWNPNLYGVNPIWTMKFAPSNAKKIAYAPSIGISNIPDKFASAFKDSLKDYSYISCREQEGADSLNKILKGRKNVDVVLDPTLLLSPNEWHAFARNVNISKPYVFCYLFGDYEYISKVKSQVKKYFGIDFVSLPYNLRELIDDDVKLYDITPNQFVWLIENAKFVITDSFHASVFSIKMSTPFIVLKRTSDNNKKNMNSRIYTLLRTIGLESRMLGEQMLSDIQYTIESTIDFQAANEKLSNYIKRDIAKLSNAISNE